ncbi:MAG: gliding motility-associated C-terminal domain-containing protein [Flavobacteriales bacterium]|nr:gliding motility-associated C-terminal domain-containing protein [Flavobacteriales bacterium]
MWRLVIRVCLSICAQVAIVSALFAAPLDPPILHCANVDANGDVTISWTPITDPGGEFQQYDIYHSALVAGPFAPLTTIFALGQSSFVHLGAGADIGPQFYYMTTGNNTVPSEISIPSDTIATLFLQVFQSTPLGSANLSWNAPATAPTAANEFSVWLEYPIGSWSMLGSVSDTVFSYQHVVDICEDSLTFRIGLFDASGCISYSNHEGDVFADATPPSMPILTAVTVDSLTGLTSINWAPSPEPDTDGYIVLWVTPTGGVIIDTLYGQNNTSYTWLNSNSDIGSESFTVAAFDTCEVGVPPSPNTSATRAPHSTVHVDAQYDLCGAQVDLSWSEYVGWEAESYQILAQVDGGLWNILSTVPSTQTSYVHDVAPDRSYCYVIKAIKVAGTVTSLSNKVCVLTYYPNTPSFNYIQTVTVTGANQITIVDSVDMNATVGDYRFERSRDGGQYLGIATAPGSSGPTITITDNDVEPSLSGYRYRVIVRDSCGVPALTSNVGGSILLRAEPDLDGTNKLDWNGYEDWAGNVGSYTIHRSIEDMPFEVLAVVPSMPWKFTDPVQDLTATDGKFCYFVVANEVGNPSGIDSTSMSNTACAVQEELVYIPNAFVLGGYNPTFFPVLSYVDVEEYELSIINRWGMIIWSTNDPEEPWDGRIESGCAPIGIYGYYLSVRNGTGRQIERRGTVTLLTASD